MAQYTLIANDGTRTVVKYDPRHDGPVSERLTLKRRIRWLSKWCHAHPGDRGKKKQLADLQNSLSSNRSAFERPQKRKHQHQRQSWNERRAPNRTSKASVPLDPANKPLPQQRLVDGQTATPDNANHAPPAFNAPATNHPPALAPVTPKVAVQV